VTSVVVRLSREYKSDIYSFNNTTTIDSSDDDSSQKSEIPPQYNINSDYNSKASDTEERDESIAMNLQLRDDNSIETSNLPELITRHDDSDSDDSDSDDEESCDSSEAPTLIPRYNRD